MRQKALDNLREIIDHYHPLALTGDREAAWIVLKAIELALSMSR